MTREDRFAEYMSRGYSVREVREMFGLTKGQAAGVWARIKRKLGPQAC
jgi:transposase